MKLVIIVEKKNYNLLMWDYYMYLFVMFGIFIFV